jgi:hypothetical protein
VTRRQSDLPTLPVPRPATRIGRTVIFPGGAVIQLSRIQRVLFALGLRKSLSTRTNERRNA